ncbi:CHAT domain-containing protein [Aspergillus affinis]|uniref:CHAT domain-containing protein n=1 Tax=Aspergillus affinis TaxID=1070780 RepID=UPI0022FE88BD|nr:uncharacterized protein KD926_002595 [Aspergillus affinis]KAI9035930.1 hypothetical protein KD926_002595 [Aspergillus affinis]
MPRVIEKDSIILLNLFAEFVDSRSDEVQLHHDHPQLAKEYDRLRQVLSHPLKDSAERATKLSNVIKWKQDAPRQLDACLVEIRSKTGYENFHLEPAFSDPIAQAVEGPIVTINVTELASDAIILLSQEIHVLNLPGMHTSISSHFGLSTLLGRFRNLGDRGSHRDMQGEMDTLNSVPEPLLSYYRTSSLAWLWECCVCPVLGKIEALTSSTPSSDCPLNRIWWIGTGVASSLPFHAVGHGPEQPTENTMHRVISSYTPTIKALTYFRSCLNKITATTLNQDVQSSITIVAMPTTPAGRSLPGVFQEIEVIQKAAAAVSAAYKVQVEHQPGAEAILEVMKKHNIIHFTCHGSCDPGNPSESHLLLQHHSNSDNPSSTPGVERLTVQQISDHVASQARITFLSACSTAQITAEKLTYEAIHLASAFQVAVGHLIASMWSANDDACPEVARHFYGQLLAQFQEGRIPFSNRSVAEALHNAVWH